LGGDSGECGLVAAVGPGGMTTRMTTRASNEDRVRCAVLGLQRPVPDPTHPAEAAPRQAKLKSARPIVVGDNVWLGGGVVVYPGVGIGENTVVGAGAVGPGFCRGRRASLLDGRSADALRRDGSVAWWATSSLPISRAGSTPAGAEGAEGATSQKGGASLKSPPPCSCMPAHRPPGVVGSTHSGVRVGRRPWVVVVVTTWYRARSNGKGGP
jgi:hypothetical protein